MSGRLHSLTGEVQGTARFDGTVELITGATSAIGKATALSLAAGGARVLAVGRDPSRGEAVMAAIRRGRGTADFLAADLRSADSARALPRRAMEAGAGRVDILLNNVRDSSRRADRACGTFPAERAASAEEIAAAITFLASDAASYANGAVLPVDGGRTAI